MLTASMHGDLGGNLAQKSILCVSAPTHETERVRDLANTFNVGHHPFTPYRTASQRQCASLGAMSQSDHHLAPALQKCF